MLHIKRLHPPTLFQMKCPSLTCFHFLSDFGNNFLSLSLSLSLSLCLSLSLSLLPSPSLSLQPSPSPSLTLSFPLSLIATIVHLFLPSALSHPHSIESRAAASVLGLLGLTVQPAPKRAWLSKHSTPIEWENDHVPFVSPNTLVVSHHMFPLVTAEHQPSFTLSCLQRGYLGVADSLLLPLFAQQSG